MLYVMAFRVNSKILQKGDIINIDITVILDGWHGDSSRMYAAGKLNKKAELLLKTTYECLMKGIEIAKAWKMFWVILVMKFKNMLNQKNILL